MDKNVHEITPSSEDNLNELELNELIGRLMERLASLPSENEARERYVHLQQELDDLDLIQLLECFMWRFGLTQGDTAVMAQMDSSAFSKILKGERRQLKQENVDFLLDDLRHKNPNPFHGWIEELLAWHRALRVAAVIHVQQYKDIEPRLKNIKDMEERLATLKNYFEQLQPAWAKLYEITKGQMPALLPLSLHAARHLLKEWDWIVVPEGYELHDVRHDCYDLISTDLIPRKIKDLEQGLRVKDTGFGTCTIYHQRQTLDLPRLAETFKKVKPRQLPEEPPTQPDKSKISDRKPGHRTKRFIEPELVRIDAGLFWMGSDASDKDALDIEKPSHRLYLPEYWIGRCTVTHEEYRCFLLGNPDCKKPLDWHYFDFPAGKANHPVVNISWRSALDYCRWLSDVSGKSYTLPSEPEWEKAARGIDRRIYPWGDKWQSNYANTAKIWKSSPIGIQQTTPVGQFSPQGDSPYGCADMAGNVWEWTRSLWGEAWREPEYGYPYDPHDGREDLNAPGSPHRVLRGGSFIIKRRLARCTCRSRYNPGGRSVNFGFRVVVSPFQL